MIQLCKKGGMELGAQERVPGWDLFFLAGIFWDLEAEWTLPVMWSSKLAVVVFSLLRACLKVQS